MQPCKETRRHWMEREREKNEGERKKAAGKCISFRATFPLALNFNLNDFRFDSSSFSFSSSLSSSFPLFSFAIVVVDINSCSQGFSLWFTFSNCREKSAFSTTRKKEETRTHEYIHTHSHFTTAPNTFRSEFYRNQAEEFWVCFLKYLTKESTKCINSIVKTDKVNKSDLNVVLTRICSHHCVCVLCPSFAGILFGRACSNVLHLKIEHQMQLNVAICYIFNLCALLNFQNGEERA